MMYDHRDDLIAYRNDDGTCTHPANDGDWSNECGEIVSGELIDGTILSAKESRDEGKECACAMCFMVISVTEASELSGVCEACSKKAFNEQKRKDKYAQEIDPFSISYDPELASESLDDVIDELLVNMSRTGFILPANLNTTNIKNALWEVIGDSNLDDPFIIHHPQVEVKVWKDA